MEPPESDYPISQTDIINVENVEYRTPSPVTSCAGSDCSISVANAVAAAEAAVEERNDVMLRLMGHLIPGSIGPEEGSASETNSSIDSSPSTFKRRLHNLPSSSEAVKLADRVAALNRRIRKERDLYLHLQGLTNRIEEKDEANLSTTDSSITINSTYDRHHQGQISNARARRRERLNSGLTISQHQISSDLQFCSPDLSSPEPLTLREIREDSTEETDQLSTPIKEQYSIQNNPPITQDFEVADETMTSYQATRNICPVITDCTNLTAMVDKPLQGHAKISDYDFDCNLSSEVANAQVRTTTSSAASSIDVDYAYVTRKKTPMKFGGYRPTPGLIFRNLSSDSESDATSDRIAHKGLRIQNFLRENTANLVTHDTEEQKLGVSDAKSNNLYIDPDRIKKVEPFSVEKIEVLEERLLSPVLSAHGKLLSEESNLSQRLEAYSEDQITEEIGRTPVLRNQNNHYMGKIENAVEQRHSVECTIAGPFNNADPKISSLQIESRDYSQSHSLFSEGKGETTRSSLDVNALIQALSDVSLKQKNSPANCINQSMRKLKSPVGYENKFSGSSGPRSSEEYTPAAGGSRQSLTSLEVSETHSVKIPKAEVTLRRQATSSMKPYEQNAKSASRTPEVFEDLSQPPLSVKKVPIVSSAPLGGLPIEVDLSRGSSFIPVVAKVNKTNLVCPKHPLKIKSIGKLISPRKYPGKYFNGEIADILTSRTDVSQLSEGSRKSFRSLKSVQPETKAHRKRVDDMRPKTENSSLRIPLSGRRILKPLNSVPKVQQDFISSFNGNFERRKKTANDLSEIISSQSEADSERATTAISSGSSSRRSPVSRNSRADVPVHWLAQRLKNPAVHSKHSPHTRGKRSTHHAEVSSSKEAQGEAIDSKLMEHSFKGQNCSSISSEKSSVTSDNVLYLRSKRLSMSSGEYGGKITWSAHSKDEDLTENDDTYYLEDKLYDEKQPVSADREKMSEVIDLDAQNTGLSNLCTNCYTQKLTSSFRNCVHVNDLQDGREVTLPCGNAKSQEDTLREKELFERLPNEISISLTRHASFGTQVTENLNSSKEIPSTIEDLGKNIQENNDQWIKDFENDEDLDNTIPKSADDKVSFTSSSLRFKNAQSPNVIWNPTEFHHKIAFVDPVRQHSQPSIQKTVGATENSCFTSCVASIIDRGYHDIGGVRQESEYSSEPGQLDSQRTSLIDSGNTSLQNTYRSITASTDSTTVFKFDETPEPEVSEWHSNRTIEEPSVIESLGNFKKKRAVNAETQNVELCDVQVISSTVKDTSEQKHSSKIPFLTSTSDNDKHSRKALNFSTKTKSIWDDKVKTVEAMSSKITQFESCLSDDSVSNTPLECSQSQLNELADSDKYYEQGEEKSTSVGYDQENQFANELQDGRSSSPVFMNRLDDPYPTRCSDNGFWVCEKKSSPSSTRSPKSQAVTQHHQDATISSPVSVKSFLSMSKLNLSRDSKWDVTVVTGANSVRKSQDRFPFTISESASRKTSKFKVVADVSLDQLMQDHNIHAERNDSVLMQQPILAKSGDQEKVTNVTVDTQHKIESCQESPTRQLTPFLEELTSKISNDSPHNWDSQIPIGLNYMSYGYREEPRTSMFTVKDIVKKFSAKLRYAKTKRLQDPEETKVTVLYRNKKYRCDSGAGSSSAASLYQSHLITNDKLIPGQIFRGSNDGSRTSSGKAMKAKRNHERIGMSMQHSPRKGCDQNDLWIQEFDSDLEFESQASTVAHRPDPKTDANSVNDRYSVFLARRKLSGMIDEADYNQRTKMGSVLNHCEGGDNEKVNFKRPTEVYELFTETQGIISKSPSTPANSYNSNTNEVEIDTTGDNFEDSTARSGCCCFRIYHFFATSRKRSLKVHRRIKD